MRNCPICNKLYRNVHQSDLVCQRHQEWKVTTCMGCGHYVFSDCVGVCPDCTPEPDDDYSTIERNALFREIGLKRG